MSRTLSADELMAGASLTHEVEVPLSLLSAESQGGGGEETEAGTIVLRPLTLADVRRVVRAAKGDGPLTSLLMVQGALVAPKLSIDQISGLPAGLVQFLLTRVNAISGLTLQPETLQEAVRDPMARACLVLSRELGWTPAQCAELTVGQILMHLELLGQDEHATDLAAEREGFAA